MRIEWFTVLKAFFQVQEYYASNFAIVHVIKNVIRKLKQGIAGPLLVAEAKLTGK